LTIRGGPQVIPRPPGTRPGRPAPWASLSEAERQITGEGLRAVFAGRQGAPSAVEGSHEVRPSAVLACFWEHEGDLEVLLTRRAGHLRAHRGEVSFPGGRSDPGETLLSAALREAHEEVRLDPAGVDVLGELDHLMTVSSRSFIVPFVSLLPGRPEGLVANPAEVDALLYVPVAELLLDEVFREELWTWSGPPAWAETGAVERSIFFFELVGDTLWGATAAMVRQLLGLALGIPLEIDHA
jgi:8-oxo-dGTP pyrophosphatase MutT (NUDIX family)